MFEEEIKKDYKFERLNKYLVLKLDDIRQFLSPQAKLSLEAICEEIGNKRKEAGKKENIYVVVNEDETYAELVWQLIKSGEEKKHSQLFEPKEEKPPILDETEYDKIYPDFTYLQPSKQSFTKQLLIAQRDADAQWYEAKIGQVKIDIFNKTVQAAEHRERFVIERTRRETDAISYAKGVLDGIKKGRQETAKEILGYFKECHPEDWENLEARYGVEQ